ncbi:MAG: polysaccharide deacetylase family protein [Clostridia bacterium]|nr:polysaccharide deacetylase family protein [Clostridia bacterium]
MKRILAALLCLLLLVPALAAGEQPAYAMQDCHRQTLTETQTKQRNGAIVSLWQISTVQASVDEELNAIASAWADEIGPTLPAPGSSNSRVNCIIKPSRTGLTWMSFMLQARTIVNTQTREVRFTTRTYDMTTGEPVRLTDVFPADSAAWEYLADAVEASVNAYWPDTAPDAEALAAATTREALENAEFTLHGMSLVLHLHAGDFYPGKQQLIEVTLYYPDVRPMMTERARQETDNANLYYMVALTFDDGPNGWCTDQTLLALMKAGERATFFLVGERVVQQQYLVQREHDEGNRIASHNYQHVYANSTAISTLQAMPAKADAAHITAIGLPVPFARAPGGQWENMAKAQMGWPLIQWTVEAADWEGEDGPDPRQTSGNIVFGTDDGGIILMHDLKRNSPKAVEMILAELQERGYMFLTVDELFAMDGVALEADTPYWRCTDGYTLKELPAQP